MVEPRHLGSGLWPPPNSKENPDLGRGRCDRRSVRFFFSIKCASILEGASVSAPPRKNPQHLLYEAAVSFVVVVSFAVVVYHEVVAERPLVVAFRRPIHHRLEAVLCLVKQASKQASNLMSLFITFLSSFSFLPFKDGRAYLELAEAVGS